MAGVQSFPPQTAKALRKILNAMDAVNPVVALQLEFMALTGLRFSDASKITQREVIINGVIKDSINVVQQKVYNKRVSCGNSKASAKAASTVTVFFNEQCKEIIQDALKIVGSSKVLFQSHRRKDKPYTIYYINGLLKDIAKDLKLNYALSTHSFRKAFALMLVKNNTGIHQVRDCLGQSSLASTDAYLRTFISETKVSIAGIKF